MNARSVAAAAVIATVVAAAAACGGGTSEDESSASIGIHFSKFGPGDVTVPAGVPVTFRLRNDDPIEHEWIVGPPDVHEAHRTGTEPFHNVRPTEVTVPAFSSRETTITFDGPGTFEFICHLPGHEAYGMKGTLRVVDDPSASIQATR